MRPILLAFATGLPLMVVAQEPFTIMMSDSQRTVSLPPVLDTDALRLRAPEGDVTFRRAVGSGTGGLAGEWGRLTTSVTAGGGRSSSPLQPGGGYGDYGQTDSFGPAGSTSEGPHRGRVTGYQFEKRDHNQGAPWR